MILLLYNIYFYVVLKLYSIRFYMYSKSFLHFWSIKLVSKSFPTSKFFKYFQPTTLASLQLIFESRGLQSQTDLLSLNVAQCLAQKQTNTFPEQPKTADAKGSRHGNNNNNNNNECSHNGKEKKNFFNILRIRCFLSKFPLKNTYAGWKGGYREREREREENKRWNAKGQAKDST